MTADDNRSKQRMPYPSALRTKSTTSADAAARFTLKMPLLPQPNCQRTPSPAPRVAGRCQFDRGRPGRQYTLRPTSPSPIQLYGKDPPRSREPQIYRSAIRLSKAKAPIPAETPIASPAPLPMGTAPRSASQLYRTAPPRQAAPNRHVSRIPATVLTEGRALREADAKEKPATDKTLA
jgi:hypothetical protein